MFNVPSFSLVESKFFINVSKENRKIYLRIYVFVLDTTISSVSISFKYKYRKQSCNNFQLLFRVIFIETIEKNLNIPKQNLPFHEFERILDR